MYVVSLYLFYLSCEQSIWLFTYNSVSQQEAHNKVVSPPKPPRAHDWKLLVKNIRVTLNQEEDAAGQMLFCPKLLLYPLYSLCHVCLLVGTMASECVRLHLRTTALVYCNRLTLYSCGKD